MSETLDPLHPLSIAKFFRENPKFKPARGIYLEFENGDTCKCCALTAAYLTKNGVAALPKLDVLNKRETLVKDLNLSAGLATGYVDGWDGVGKWNYNPDGYEIGYANATEAWRLCAETNS